MQETWRRTKTSKMHFHSAPLKNVPVPKFDPDNAVHRRIVKIVNQLEKENTSGLEVLNGAVEKLLPDYVT